MKEAIVLQAVKTLVTEVVRGASSRVTQALTRWRSGEGWRQLYEKQREIRRVKTFLDVERRVDLESFYSPPSVVVNDREVMLEDLDEVFGDRKQLVLEGIIGQGKSMLLRHLAVRELRDRERVPLFLELRSLNVDSGQIGSLLLAEFALMGFPEDEEVFDAFAAAGKLVLLLDGFDEIRPVLREKARAELEELTRKYPEVRVVVTSRPHSGIGSSFAFETFSLSLLGAEGYRQVLAALTGGEDEHSRLLGELEKSGKKSERIRGLLVTPLIVTLVLLYYRRGYVIPDTLAGFYDQLFDVCLSRFDSFKLLDRTRTSSLGNHELKECFETLCFLTRREGQLAFKSDELHGYAARTLDAYHRDVDPAAFLSDIRDITCLMLEEGSEWSFIHAGVAEYHSARCMRERSRDDPAKFYGLMKGANLRRWSQELDFLREIDEYNYRKYYVIPTLEDLLESMMLQPGEAARLSRKGFLRFCEWGDAKLVFPVRPTASKTSSGGGVTIRFALGNSGLWGLPAHGFLRAIALRARLYFRSALEVQPKALEGCRRERGRGVTLYEVRDVYREFDDFDRLLESLSEVAKGVQASLKEAVRADRSERRVDGDFFDLLD